jgi:5-formyltetrahydrofolate cyclo-ligase
MPGEPDTGPLLDALCAGGTTVLLPVLLPDLDLDWAAYSPKDSALQRGRFGLREPTMPALGVSAVAGADVVVCPGIAVDLAGHRLGRGGGSYDRALRRLSPGTPRVVLVYDDEVLDAVPVTDHDEPVHIALTPTRTLRLPAAVGT